MKPVREQSSVQHDMLRLRETKGDMLCLYAPGSPMRRSYRAVLEVSPINLSLKAEDEQEAIIERFGALIRSLSFPVQILVRNQRLDLTPYIQHLLAQPGAGGQHPSTWLSLAAQPGRTLTKDCRPAHAYRTPCLHHHPGLTGLWQFQKEKWSGPIW